MMRVALLPVLVLAVVAHAQTSPFNGRQVLPPDSAGNYRLLIGGHFHGASTNRSGYPAATLLANLDTIHALGAHALVSTGDLFLDHERDGARYRHAFFDRLRVPLFNTPGNHDTGAAYEKAYGPTHQVLHMGKDQIVLLDTELNNGSIKGGQLATLRGLAEQPPDGHVFIISHRPIWAEDDPAYGPLFEGNTRSLLPTNFRKEVFPLLEKMAQQVQVYWISGSMAGRAPSSIFFQPHAPNITYIQSAIRDELRDALLVADVSPTGIRWQGISLTGQELEAVETYDAAWWKARQNRPEPFKWRQLPYRAKMALQRAEFWWGAVTSLLLLLLLRRLVRRWIS